MKVFLGSYSLRAFVTAPKYFNVVGAVYMGQEYGLLATNKEGVYLRVNGSQNMALDQQQVQKAICVAHASGHTKAGPRVPKPAVPKVVHVYVNACRI